MFNLFQYSHLTLLHPKKDEMMPPFCHMTFYDVITPIFPAKLLKLKQITIICDKVANFFVQNWNNARESHCYARECPGEIATIMPKHSWRHVRALWRHGDIIRWGKADFHILFPNNRYTQLQIQIRIWKNWSIHTKFLLWNEVIFILH